MNKTLAEYDVSILGGWCSDDIVSRWTPSQRRCYKEDRLLLTKASRSGMTFSAEPLDTKGGNPVQSVEIMYPFDRHTA